MSNWKLMAVLCNWALKFLYWEKHNKLMTMPNTMSKWNGGAETEAMLFLLHPCFNSVPLLLDSILLLFFFNLFYSPTSCKLYLLLNWWDELRYFSLILVWFWHILCVWSAFSQVRMDQVIFLHKIDISFSLFALLFILPSHVLLLNSKTSNVSLYQEQERNQIIWASILCAMLG